MRRGISASFAIVVSIIVAGAAPVACGAAALETAPVVPFAAPSASTPEQVPTPRDDPWVTFATFVLDAAHAAMAAADGQPHDARWDCADAAHDIRATSPDEGQKLRAKGNPEFLIALLGEIDLEAQLEPGADPAPSAGLSNADHDEEGASQRRRDDRWLSVNASAAVFADGKVRWLAARGFGRDPSGLSPRDAGARVRLKATPPEIRGALGEVVRSLSSPRCSLAFLSVGDLASFPLSDAVRREATESLPREAERLKNVCALAAHATGSWSVTLSRLQVAFSVKDEVAQLRADVHVENDRVCIGQVEALLKD